MRGFDSNLAGAYVRLEMPGRCVIGEVRAVWFEETSRPAVPNLVLLIELDPAPAHMTGAEGGAPAVAGEVRAFRYSPNGGDHRLTVIHDANRRVH